MKNGKCAQNTSFDWITDRKKKHMECGMFKKLGKFHKNLS
jgi:hypothetical protein